MAKEQVTKQQAGRGHRSREARSGMQGPPPPHATCVLGAHPMPGLRLEARRTLLLLTPQRLGRAGAHGPGRLPAVRLGAGCRSDPAVPAPAFPSFHLPGPSSDSQSCQARPWAMRTNAQRLTRPRSRRARGQAPWQADGACSERRGPAVPVHSPDREAPPVPSQPWNCASAIPRLSLPLLPCHEEALGPSRPEPLDVSWTGPRAGSTPSVALRASLNHLNLPLLLPPPTQWPPIPGPDGDGAPDKPLKDQGMSRVPGGFECTHCHRPYHTPAGLARHQQLHCHLPAGRPFTCRYCDKVYASLGALKMHIRTHTLPCICKVCGKAFSRPWLLQGHARTHT
ncbi:PREDICTED: zinc finger protein SNAI3-like, partial [Dipodomys ordii]|uniref:Zinc finger protein SNAI3-like n=1 Tax=Dipodomys ordii TaxID=10020 RepID=A0A1S3GUB5_DIPOR